ncbi:MAG: response regulator [Gemmatimonadetes bacterium]|nr:response regulator [Gemmatimonadota bacterium]
MRKVVPDPEADPALDRGVRALIDSVPALLWIAGPDGRVRAASRQWGILTGLAEDTGTEERLATIHPDDRNRVGAGWRRAVARGLPFEAEFRVRRGADGAWRSLLARARPVQDEAGTVQEWYGSATDVTELREASASLESRERAFHQLADMAALQLYVFDLDRAHTRWMSGELLPILGYPSDPALERSGSTLYRSLMHPHDHEAIPGKRARQRLLEDGEVLETEFRMRGADGAWRWFQIREMAFERGRDGLVSAVIGTLLEVSDRKRAEEQLTHSRALFSGMAEAMPGLLFLYDCEEGRDIYLNRSLNQLLDRGEEAPLWLPLPDAARVHPDDVPRAKRRLDSFLAHASDGDVLEESLRLLHVDGTWRTLLVRSVVFARDEDGGVRQLLGVAHDDTDRHRAEHAVLESEARLRAILNSVPDGILTLDGAGRVLRANPAAETMFGRSMAELIGMAIETLIPAAAAGEGKGDGALDRLRAVGRSADVVRPDGSRTPVEVALSRIDSDDGPLFTALLRDVSERRRTEHAIEEARQAEAAANRAKTEFLANTSHEIRTPMTAILGNVDLLAGRLTDPGHLRSLEAIRRNGQHLLDIINDILHLSKMDAPDFRLRLEPVSLGSFLSELHSLVEERAQAKGLSFRIERETLLPGRVHTDPRALRQILLNLVSNAVKFTDQGEVAVGVCVESDPLRLVFAVRDTGMGIPSHEIGALFDAFTQGTSAPRRGGTGLGLAISRRLAERLDGAIDVESTPGRGSLFRLRLPLTRAEMGVLLDPGEVVAEAIADRTRVRDLHGTILIAEDNPEIRDLAVRFIEEAGGRTVAAEHGLQAVDAVESARRSGAPIDLVLLDLYMPVMDGYETARVLRREGYDGPIVALSAHAMPEDRERCLRAGCDDFLAKPLTPAALVERLGQHLEARKGTDATGTGRDGGGPDTERRVGAADATERMRTMPQQPSTGAGRSAGDGGGVKRRILLVDDSPDVLEAQSLLLEIHGYDVATAETGAQALERAEAWRPDLVLLDLGLPDQSGYTVLERLRALPGLADTRFVAFSGRGEPEDRVRSAAAGFHAHLVKPATLADIEAAFG